ncbi:hypothetical protein MCHI_004003 [Candidatus Magnetoovum chiemensis]|nr:hypothetical protein MCHI_004003 [Candidatus Magnetoovum chiemensis]
METRNIDKNLALMWEDRKTMAGQDIIFGLARNPHRVYIDCIVEDRMILVHGFKLLNDELKFAPPPIGADFSKPAVITTLAHTICGDRLNQGQPIDSYKMNIATRFATISEMGEIKFERFYPAGGGTDDSKTLAHVTIAHACDTTIRNKLHSGNPESYILYNFDLQTHVGRIDKPNGTIFGKAQESPYREQRLACGAIVGALTKFDSNNTDHRRVRNDLGEKNYDYLSKHSIESEEGIDVTYAVASSIVAVQGMYKTIEALKTELDRRDVAHLTASMNINRVSIDDTVVLLARATMYNGIVKIQGLGADALKYKGRKVGWSNDTRLLLQYNNWEPSKMPIETIAYTPSNFLTLSSI